jgi:hypothetical protein
MFVALSCKTTMMPVYEYRDFEYRKTMLDIDTDGAHSAAPSLFSSHAFVQVSTAQQRYRQQGRTQNLC